MNSFQALAERLLIGDRADDLGELSRREPVASLLSSASTRLAQLGIDPMQADIEAHYRWIEGVTMRVVAPVSRFESNDTPARADGAPDVLPYETPDHKTLTQKVDRILVHKVWGLLVFAAIMGALFFAIFWIADPMMGAMEEGVGALGSLVAPLLPEGPLQDMWTDGIVAGVGGILVFVPQIAMLFLFLAVLEDSGYLARAAFLMDRLLAKVGLHGKSFIPLLSSFACAIPGIMSARTIENRQDRLATIFVAPFMSCSARLPVYALLIGTFFAAYGAMTQAGIMLALYALGIVAAAGTAWVFKRSLLKGPATAFILEMPTYKLPQLGQVARTVWTNTWAFVAKAGTIIFCLSIILWAMAYYPRLPEGRATEVEQQVRSSRSGISLQDFPTPVREWWEKHEDKEVQTALAAAQSEYSIAGRIGHFMEPAIRPLGYDWKMGVGLIGAFAAREVFVSTMGIIYSVGDAEDDTEPLSAALQSDRYPDGRPVWTPVVAVSLLVWFVLAMQCMSTLAIVRRETGGWKWPVFMLVYMNALAYVVALVVYQVGSRIWT